MGSITVEGLERLLSDVEVPILKDRGKGNGKVAQASAREIFRNYADVIPSAARVKLGAKKPNGDRSRVLWGLSNALLDAGLSPGEVVALVEKSVWNKFGEDRGRLWADVNKAAAGRAKSGRTSGNGKKKPQDWAVALDRYLAVESRDPQWMIEGLWSDKSHGIIAGEPKTRKTYVAIDIALSVATGTDCLGHFPVRKQGAVLMLQEEVSDAEMRKRLRFIAASKGLGGKVHKKGDEYSVHLPEPVPLYLRNRKQFDLSNPKSFRKLHKHIEAKDIKLLILDPLQLMLGQVDENKASEVRPILYNFLQLKEETGCGIMILHHYAKSSSNNPRKGGQRMLGSQAFHGWVESALYLTKDENYVTHVEREFRNFDPFQDFSIEYVGGNEKYEVEVRENKAPKKKAPPDKFERYCLKHEGIPVKDLAAVLKASVTTIRKRVEASKHVKLEDKVAVKGGRPRKIVVKI